MNSNEKFNNRFSRKEGFDELKKENAMDDDFEWYLRKLVEKDGNEENDDDPQYVQFLKNLSVNGKSYKLAIFENNKLSHYIKYEEREEDEELNCEFDNNEDKANSGEIQEKINEKEVDISEVSRKNENNKHVFSESGYQMVLNGYTPDQHGGYNLDGINVKYENKPTTSYDSDIQVLENINDFDEVEDHKSLREKLIRILRKPFSRKEYDQLWDDLQKKKPICRLLPLRGRDISSAKKGEGKSDLDYAPGRFRRKLEDAKREGQLPKVLNLMRMYRFCLENPNDIFKPWSDEECLRVEPGEHTK